MNRSLALSRPGAVSVVQRLRANRWTAGHARKRRHGPLLGQSLVPYGGSGSQDPKPDFGRHEVCGHSYRHRSQLIGGCRRGQQRSRGGLRSVARPARDCACRLFHPDRRSRRGTVCAEAAVAHGRHFQRERVWAGAGGCAMAWRVTGHAREDPQGAAFGAVALRADRLLSCRQ
jgi:hypothetical protein